MLALGGIDIALSQLSFKAPDVNESKKSSSASESFEQLWFKRIFPLMNKWQNFNISKIDNSMLNSTLDIYMACENSKININFLAQSLADEIEKAIFAAAAQKKPTEKREESNQEELAEIPQ